MASLFTLVALIVFNVLICSHRVFVPLEMKIQSGEDIEFIVNVNLMGTFSCHPGCSPGDEA